MNNFSDLAIKYYLNLTSPDKIPGNVKVINPYLDKEIRIIVTKFFDKYYSDANERTYIFGINPGRFGGGITGISFTDPVALNNSCGIQNNFGARKELSSEFIYMMISSYGGVKKFFSKFFLSALYPLALLKDGKNFNYYDDRKLYRFLKPFLIKSIKEQTKFGCSKRIVISLGKKNADYLKELNDEIHFFKEIIALPHPRFIMQYRRKSVNNFIQDYLKILHTT
jgi:Uracil DNA glycosylase superfamily